MLEQAKKKDVPREVELALVDCFCDYCSDRLDNLKTIWVWNEHFCCSRDHCQRAQGRSNSFAADEKSFKRSLNKSEERDIDLL